MIIEADKHTFDTYLKEPSIVDFFTTDCPSCQKFSPVFDKAASGCDKYTFIKVNLDDDITLAERYGITHVPTIIKFVEAKPVKTASGYMDASALAQFLES